MTELILSVLIPMLTVAVAVGAWLVFFAAIAWAGRRWRRHGHEIRVVQPQTAKLPVVPDGVCMMCGAVLAKQAAPRRVVSDIEHQIAHDSRAIALLLRSPARENLNRLYVA